MPSLRCENSVSPLVMMWTLSTLCSFSNVVVPQLEVILPPADLKRCLETFLTIMTREACC